jgi:predicted PurR-regulated permease PerM
VRTLQQAGVILAILAAAVVVVGGLAALVRSIWGVAQTLRDNTKATGDLSEKMEALTASIDGRFDALADRVTKLEQDRQGTVR